jgi:hypothetical protein
MHHTGGVGAGGPLPGQAVPGQAVPGQAVPDEFDLAVAAFNRLPVDAADVPDAVLVSRMRRLVQLRAMVDAALAEQVAAFDARAAARYDGQTSTQGWLRSRLRLGGLAAQLLLVARQLADLPQVAKAFAAGEISLEHTAALARLVGQVGAGPLAGYEPILLDLARQVAPAPLRVACEQVRQLLDAEGGAGLATRQRRQRYLTAARTVDGMVHLQGLLDPMSGDVVLAALAAAMPVPTEQEDRTATQRRADALVDVCGGWLAAGQAPTCGGVRPQVQVTVSLQTLQSSQRPDGPRPGQASGGGSAAGPRGGLLGEVAVLAGGQPVSAGQARRLACDAGIIPVVLGAGSEPLDIGRLTRVVPVSLRRALQLRDGGCRFGGCDRPAPWCDAHHIRHWADGGATDLGNLILLCAHHHTLVHEGWRLHGHPDGTVWYRRPDGTRLDLTSAPRRRPPTRGP